MSTRVCRAPGCGYAAEKGRQFCGWHRLDRADIDTQERAAQWRIARFEASGVARAARRAAGPTSRWCSGCQSYVPMFYTSSSKCKACARRSARASHVERTYGITGEEERALYAWQGGRCAVCGRRARKRALAVDHDHETGAVRGLLCSDDKHGCNVLVRNVLNDRAAAERLLAYVQQWPIERMREGQPPWSYGGDPTPTRDDGEPPF